MVLRNMGNKSISETLLIDQLVATLRSSFPSTWSVVLRDSDRRFSVRPDAILDIEAPDGAKAFVAVEVQQAIRPRDVDRMTDQLRRYPSDASMVMAPYLTARTRELLEKSSAGFADATGNLRLALSRPAVFIKSSGAKSDPWPTERPTKSLRGPVGGRVVRALCDFRPPYGVRELAARADLLPGTLSRFLAFLEDEVLVRRSIKGRIEDVDWVALLRRWSADYSFAESKNTIKRFVEPRGLPELERKLGNSGLRYAITGSLATRRAAPIAPVRLAAVYVDSLAKAIGELGLTATETGANILLAEPFDPVVFERTWRDANGLTYAAPPQVVADLLTGPGRSPNEAEAMIAWMRKDENAWRS
jgi:hypothetical protein